MRSDEAELNQIAIAALDPHQRIADLEAENRYLRRMLARTADQTAHRELATTAQQ